MGPPFILPSEALEMSEAGLFESRERGYVWKLKERLSRRGLRNKNILMI